MKIGLSTRKPSVWTTLAILLSFLPAVLNANRRRGGGALEAGAGGGLLGDLQEGEAGRAEAIERLSQVFRLDKVPVLRHNRSPPQYMMELYNNVADHDGITKNRSPYGSDVVRGFPDRDSEHQMHFFFNVSYIGQFEKILQAEFHLFKLKARLHEQSQPLRGVHLIELRLYQVLDMRNMYSPGGARLINARRVSAHKHGWEVFKVKDTVQEWVNYTSSNQGFLVTATSLGGAHVNGTHFRFAQRSQHHDSKQPVLIVFTEEMTHRMPIYTSPSDADLLSNRDDDDSSEGSTGPDFRWNRHQREYIKLLNEEHRKRPGGRRNLQVLRSKLTGSDGPGQQTKGRSQSRPNRRSKRAGDYHSDDAHIAQDTHSRSRSSSAITGNLDRSKREMDLYSGATYMSGSFSQQEGRSKRSTDYYHTPKRRKHTCSRHELYVDFDEIGWSGWIISPRGYNAYHCKGECPFPLGQNQRPTNHATVQSIVHALRIGKNVGTPCCVPNKLYSISLLYFDDDENVILKQYDDMVAASCGCH